MCVESRSITLARQCLRLRATRRFYRKLWQHPRTEQGARRSTPGVLAALRTPVQVRPRNMPVRARCSRQHECLVVLGISDYPGARLMRQV